ncbi:MAG: STAS domain-containing protein [Methylophilaceae bacterium]|nr:STAS domain-containing protein [Methylophilaceae bacterium]
MAQITQQGDNWQISGMMTMPHIDALLAESALLPWVKALKISLADVQEVDTATISLLFEWLRQAQAHNSEIVFTDLPKNLISLATLYDVLELIPQAGH